MDLMDFKGQETAKRALEIAASGRHSLLLVANRGQGKTVLLTAFRAIFMTVGGSAPHWEETRPEHLPAWFEQDHFDMVLGMGDLPVSDWFLPTQGHSSEVVGERVRKHSGRVVTNPPLDMPANKLLAEAAEKLRMSPRDIISTTQVAKTIAWMDFLDGGPETGGPETTGRVHVAEALSYCQRREEDHVQRAMEQN